MTKKRRLKLYEYDKSDFRLIGLKSLFDCKIMMLELNSPAVTAVLTNGFGVSF